MLSELLTTAVFAVLVALSLVVNLIGYVLWVALGYLVVLAVADMWEMAVELLSKRGRRRARLLRHVQRRRQAVRHG